MRGASGAVLLFVLALVALLSALAVQTVRTSQLEVFSAYAGIYSRQAEAMAESGLLAAASLLAADEASRASVNLTQDWASFPQLTSYPGKWFLDGQLQGRIDDELGKFPVNSLHPGLTGHAVYGAVFLRLLQAPPFSLPSGKAQALLAALVDWLDPDDVPANGGAEDAAYQADALSYRVKNNSLDTLGELLCVKGFSRELLYGRDKTPGLFSLLTVWGPGLVNVNTAPVEVLAALPANIDASRARTVAKALDDYRRDPVRRDRLETLEWLGQAAPDQGLRWPSEILTTRSVYFSVTLEGVSGAASKRLFAVLKRNQQRRSAKAPDWDVLYRELR
ncbi:type II secretion system minor pseudopilin GspK [Solidesulfovibrio sp.]|uniref:type II secretion system minor pseudopilin GspK n=1 Tax=Solidesulfovibrio sp. TaxID=2910990 RepID=UPI00260EED37|nr:type II secretion system minor pseudopilin GspK [Solidesulfovibrio sp.]